MFTRNHAVPRDSPSQKSKWLIVLVLALVAWSAWSARAQPLVAQKAGANVTNTDLKLVELAVLHHVNPAHGLPEILAGKSGIFVPQSQLDLKDSGWADTDFWLRLTLAGIPLQEGQTAPAIYLLEFSKAYLDDIRLYSPPLNGTQAWRVQKAGDMVAQKDWYFRGLYPRFLLPSAQDLMASPSGQQVLYVQIKHSFPLTSKVQIFSAEQTVTFSQKTFLALGVVLGAMLLTAALSASMALLNRDSIFGWYFAYAICAILSNVSHSGMAHFLLWPVDGWWPGTATMFWLLMAALCQLQFCRVLFQPQDLKTLPAFAAIGWGGLCGVTAIAYAFLPKYWTEFYFFGIGLILVAMALSIFLVYQAWRQNNKLALVWLISFVPLFITIVIGLLGSVGMLEDDLGYNMPIYAVALEVILLGMALQWFARERHGQMEREKALATTDPLTGFASAQAFQAKLLRDWHSPDAEKFDFAVAYVELTTKASDAKQRERLLMRSVRILRSATHTHDVVARLDGQLMAILMPHVQMGDDLSQRLSRIVALGLMPNRGDPQASILQFRIVAATRWRYAPPLSQLDSDLRAVLADPNGWGSKTIRYVGSKASRSDAAKIMALEESKFEDLWDKAFAREVQDASKS
jgi:two-component system, sensor histidine kinase LadS